MGATVFLTVSSGPESRITPQALPATVAPAPHGVHS